MKRHVSMAFALVAVAGLAVASPARVSAGGGPTPYYVSLGDSLAQGVQPDANGNSVPTNHGYVDRLFNHYQHRLPGLQMVKLGCPGETSGTMIAGGICSYPHVSQLNEAVSFLTTHQATVVTIDIGANDLDGCVVNGTVDQECIVDGLGFISQNLPVIFAAVRGAAGPNVPIVAMNYYDPFLAAWLTGPAGQLLAKQSVALGAIFSSLIVGATQGLNIPVADVSSSFQTPDFTEVEVFEIPRNVINICSWTWMCAAAPRGPNIHANGAGYQIIANTFIGMIGPL